MKNKKPKNYTIDKEISESSVSELEICYDSKINEPTVKEGYTATEFREEMKKSIRKMFKLSDDYVL